MFYRRKRGWEVSENSVTPEEVFLNRRAFMAGTAGIAGALATAPISQAFAKADADPTADLYPAARNMRYRVKRPVTAEDLSSTYNNFYEFGSHKTISRAAQALEIRPWTVTIDGMVEKEQVVDIDALIRAMPLEERIYRHRCVERWSMIVPWTGFSLKELVAYAKPLSGAKYVRFETFMDAGMARGQKQFWYPWPYVEGVSIEEAANELPFLVTGVYGKPAAKQFGAPLRLALPWKYGFKSIKSIVRITFTDERPVSFWEEILKAEYGFWANVNPEVPHPRWSQAVEKYLGSNEEVPTVIWNGYGEFVADMYKGMEGEKLFM
jgi:methionine sulfoxide reductase catalytic subunit